MSVYVVTDANYGALVFTTRKGALDYVFQDKRPILFPMMKEDGSEVQQNVCYLRVIKLVDTLIDWEISQSQNQKLSREGRW